MSLPAAEIDPCLDMRSISSILPGPMYPDEPRLTRIVRPASRTSPPVADAFAGLALRCLAACRIASSVRYCLRGPASCHKTPRLGPAGHGRAVLLGNTAEPAVRLTEAVARPWRFILIASAARAIPRR